MALLGTVSGICRYPVKSMQGEALTDAEVGERGIPHDREYGVVDIASGIVLSAKREPRLLLGAAVTEGDRVLVTIPGEEPRAADDPGISSLLSTWLDREVRLDRATPATEGLYEFQAEGDPDAEILELPVLDGSFFDLAPLHLLSRQSLASAARLDTGVDWDVRRFRPTVLVDAGDGAFPEDDWVGNQVQVGRLRCDVIMPTMRCAMPMRAQPGLTAQPALMPQLKRGHNSLLGVYAVVVAAGRVAVGDDVSL